MHSTSKKLYEGLKYKVIEEIDLIRKKLTGEDTINTYGVEVQTFPLLLSFFL